MIQEDSHDPQFEPVIRLTEQVEAKTHEEDEEVLFKMCVLIILLFLRVVWHGARMRCELPDLSAVPWRGVANKQRPGVWWVCLRDHMSRR